MTERDPRQVRQELAEFTRAVEASAVETISIPTVVWVEAAVRPHSALEETWELYDIKTGDLLDTINAVTEEEALQLAEAGGIEYFRDDAKHI